VNQEPKSYGTIQVREGFSVKTNRFFFGSLFALLIVALLGASNIPQGWTWDKTSQWFSVLMKDGGGTKFVAAAPKQYEAGKTYNGVALTVAYLSGGGTLNTIHRGVFIPYRTVDGFWRLRLNLSISFSNATRSTGSVSVAGITCKNIGINQGLTIYNVTNAFAYCTKNTNEIGFYTGTTQGTDAMSFSGDIELEGKPTWADAN
jgi:hypothetical protein